MNLQNLYKKNALWIFFFICIIFLTSNAFGTNYYISSNGDDKICGTSPNLPLETITKGNNFNFISVDIINFQRGSD